MASMDEGLRHVILEGLPAVGKSETLELLARFYPERVRALPELVKEVAIREGIDLFADRERLTEALSAELPRRREAIARARADGVLCLEESHLGVHLAYAQALGDRSFLAAWPALEKALPEPDLYLRMESPVEVSVRRQTARGTPQFQVGEKDLRAMLAHLDAWHVARRSPLRFLDAARAAGTFVSELEAMLGLTLEEGSPDGGFDVLLLLGRPASGKSEFIDFLRRCPLERRMDRYHLAGFDVIDDFPVLWQLCAEDDLWEGLGRGRLHSRPADGNYAVADPFVWPFLIAKLDRLVRAMPPSRRTRILEFSRGGSCGYADALRQLSPDTLSRAAILYVSVSFEESCRRNLARYDAGRRSGILTHSVPREEMERTYRTDDWESLTRGARAGTLDLNGIRIPFATMGNEPESTDAAVLDGRYHDALAPLYTGWRARRR